MNSPDLGGRICTIPELKNAARDASASLCLRAALANIKVQDTATLRLRMPTTEEPLVAWALHVQLAKRGIPPVLRNVDRIYASRQLAFIATLADLHWLAAHYPEHQTAERRLRNVFTRDLLSEEWHKVALWCVRQKRHQMHRLAQALGLSDEQRAQTLTMPTKGQAADRRHLRERRERQRQRLMTHVIRHPDRSGTYATAQAHVDHYLDLIGVHVSLGRSATKTATYLTRQGHPTSRQRVFNMLAKIEAITPV